MNGPNTSTGVDKYFRWQSDVATSAKNKLSSMWDFVVYAKWHANKFYDFVPRFVSLAPANILCHSHWSSIYVVHLALLPGAMWSSSLSLSLSTSAYLACSLRRSMKSSAHSSAATQQTGSNSCGVVTMYVWQIEKPNRRKEQFIHS